MRRLGVCMLVVGLVLSMADVADAAEAREPVTGTFTGLGSFAFGPPCPFIHQVASLDADLDPLGAAEIDLDVCLEFAPVDFPASGTFTLTTVDGTLAGTLSGTSQPSGPGPEYPFHFDLSIQTGTGALQGITGTLALDGFVGLSAQTAYGTVSGTLRRPVPTPTTKADCQKGGWRDVLDDRGRPFRNQGECVRFVVHAR